ncbi:MAG: GNAT family N-acetyltransferase [Planctomycetia bacterium]|nr:GNAT family N-acetyltransferase [Planctomycetia bacterium]
MQRAGRTPTRFPSGTFAAPRRRPSRASRSLARTTGRGMRASVAPAKRKKGAAKAQLKIRVAGETVKVKAAAGKAIRHGDDVPASGRDAVRLAQGTERRPPSAKVSSAGARPAGVSRAEGAVAAVEIRPSGTVVSRRPAVKKPVIHHVPHHPILPLRPPAWMLEECQVAPARAGDQNEILQLLAGLPAPPSRAEFHAAVDHPDHDSANRLVARLAGRIVGHAEIVPRDLLVGAAAVRGAVIDRVAVLPECRGAGHGQRLVRAAEERMRQMGVAVAFSRTRIAPSFHELGWSVLGRDCATPGRPTDILARLLEGRRWNGETVTMRQWRHVELPAILRIYNQNASRFVGPLNRSENYCRWLVSRGAFDSIIVALVGQDRYELHESSARIVGYAIQSGNRVLELMADPEFAGLEREILARVCAEAIENDRQEIVYESSAADPLHAAVAGTESLVQGGDRMLVAKVFRPHDLLSALAPAAAVHVAAAGIRETVELGLDAPAFRGSIIVAEAKGSEVRQATIHPGRVGRSYLRLSDDELARLLLGQCDPVEATAAGRMEPSTQVAQKLAAQLFPRMPLWCPMWDDLPA